MNYIRKIVFYGQFIFIPLLVQAQTPADDENWNTTALKLDDDFETFNPDNWSKSFIWGSTKPDWKLIFTDDQVTPKKIFIPGILDLDYLELKAELFPSDINKPIHSGIIRYNTPIKYGYFEIRCRIRTSGMKYNSAFWVWMSNNCNCDIAPYDCSSGWSDEIDFFEALPLCTGTPGLFDKISLERNVYYYYMSCENLLDKKSFEYDINDLSQNFHTYGYEWTPNNVISYFDGIPYSYLYRTNLPYHELDLIAQLGLSDNGNEYNYPNNYMTFPAYMDIDYIKVYDLNKGDYIDYAVSTFNPDTYTYTVKKSITIQGGTSTIVSGKKVTLRAEDYILINGEFTVDNGAELTLLPTKTY